MADPQFVAGQKVILPGAHKTLRDFGGRIGSLEESPGPARFELVSPIDYLVINGFTTWLGVPEDMNGFHFYSIGAFLLAPSSGDVSIQAWDVDNTGTTFLTTPCTILAGDTSSYANPTPPVVDQANWRVVTGMRLGFEVTADVEDATGLAIAVSFA